MNSTSQEQKATFKNKLSNSEFAHRFQQHLVQRYADECYDFWTEVTLLEQLLDPVEVGEKIKLIFHTYVATDATRPVNVTGDTRSLVQSDLASGLQNPLIFAKAKKEIFDLMFINYGFDFMIENENWVPRLDMEKVGKKPLWFSPDAKSWECYDAEIHSCQLWLSSVKDGEGLVSQFVVDISKVSSVEVGEQVEDKFLFRLLPNSQYFATDSVIERLSWIQQIQKLADLLTVPRASSDPTLLQAQTSRSHYTLKSKANINNNCDSSEITERKNSLALFKPKSLDNFVRLTRDYRSGSTKSSKEKKSPTTSEEVKPAPLSESNKTKPDKSKKHDNEEEKITGRKPRVSISEGSSRTTKQKLETENIPSLNLSNSNGNESGSRSPKWRSRELRKKSPSEVTKPTTRKPIGGKIKRTISNNKSAELRRNNI